MAEPLPWPVLDPLPPGWLDDTPEEAVRVLRGMTPAQRYAAAMRARETARAWLLAGERLRHPDLDDAALRARVLARLSRAAA